MQIATDAMSCLTCHYFRANTEAEEMAMYGRRVGNGTCYGPSPLALSTIKEPAEVVCEGHWSPIPTTPTDTE